MSRISKGLCLAALVLMAAACTTGTASHQDTAATAPSQPPLPPVPVPPNPTPSASAEPSRTPLSSADLSATYLRALRAMPDDLHLGRWTDSRLLAAGSSVCSALHAGKPFGGELDWLAAQGFDPDQAAVILPAAAGTFLSLRPDQQDPYMS